MKTKVLIVSCVISCIVMIGSFVYKYSDKDSLVYNSDYDTTTHNYTTGADIAAALCGDNSTDYRKELVTALDWDELYPSYYNPDKENTILDHTLFVDNNTYAGLYKFNSDYGTMDERVIQVTGIDNSELKKIEFYKQSELKICKVEPIAENVKTVTYTKQKVETLIDDILSGDRDVLLKDIEENVSNDSFYAIVQMFKIEDPTNISYLKQSEEETDYLNYKYVSYAKTYTDNGIDKIISVYLTDSGYGYELTGVGIYEKYFEETL